MKRSKQKYAAFLGGFLYATLGLSPVWADDTEIYFSPKIANASSTNILFVLDTSGSMGDYDTVNKVKKTTSRMDDLKVAFKAVLDSINNVNVGIMRFNNAGGPVLYPVAPIDQELTDQALPATISVTTAVSAATDDAYQFTSDGKVLDGGTNVLYMGRDIMRTYINQYTVSTKVTQSSDDAESTSTTAVDLANNVLRSPRPSSGGTVYYNGIRFSQGLTGIPQNAKINEATLTTTIVGGDSTNSGWPLPLTLAAEKVDKGTFAAGSAATRPRDRYNDSGNTTTGISWSIAKPGPTFPVSQSLDVKAMVQAMVDNTAWATTTNRNATFLYSLTSGQNSGRYVNIGSFDNSNTTYRPALQIKYEAPASVQEPVVTALRFTGVNVPKGATITSARIDFTSDQDQSGTTNLAFYGELAPNTTTINAAAAGNISSRTKTTASVAWNNVPAWITGATYSSPDLKDVVQEIVNQGTAWNNGWCGENALTILVTGSVGQRIAKSYESGAGFAPKLTVTYDPSTIPKGTSCRNVTVTRQIVNGTDDVEDRSDGQISGGNSGLYMSYDSNNGGTRQVGLRFTNVQLPKSAIITSAYLEFVAKSSSSSSLGLTIAGLAQDNPASFYAPGVVRKAAKTTTVDWSNVETWTAEKNHRSPDITPIIQALVNRSGWASGNSMALAIYGLSSNRRIPYAFEGGKTKAARLVVKFRDNGTYTASYRVRDLLKDTVDSFVADGYTPSQDTLYEAALYYKGAEVDYGLRRGGMPKAYCDTYYWDDACDGPFSYGRVSSTAALVNGSTISPIRAPGCTDANLDASACKTETLPAGVKYQTPVQASCSQTNALVFLTDGEPNNVHSTDKVKALTGVATCADQDGGACVTELTKWMHDGFETSTGIPTKVTTHAIGLYEGGGAWLESVANNGGGKYYEAADATSIQEAFKEIVDTVVTATGSSFVAAGTAVNAFDRTLTRDELFFSVFEPATSPRWPGNVKKYKLSSATSPKDPLYLQIIDSSNPPKKAVDDDGFFAAGTRSYWSDVDDGAEVDKGGAGAEITSYSDRKVYTYYDSTKPILSDTANRITTAAAGLNPKLTKAMFGVPLVTDAQFQHLVDWTLGRNYDGINDPNSPTDTRYVFGDPLHSRPIAVTYSGTEANPDMTLFVTTNAGFLHAINNSDGKELFAFIPSELLPLQKILLDNLPGGDHPYGLDSTITPWVIDPEGDGVVLGTNGVAQTNNKVYLYFGMRRGGRNIYALDVTSRSDPKVMWVKKGGVDTGFANLGQTWSQPIKAQVNLNGTTKKVLIFGGGYDPEQDLVGQRTSDGMGNAIYMVDALDGSLIWSGGKTDATTTFSAMNYSIPSQVAGGDVNGDGLMDVLFVGDMGGQLWRFDIKNGATTASGLVSGGVIADLGKNDSPPDTRRFYQPPSLFISKTGDGTGYLGVALGSGYRAHPLDQDIVDRFYIVRQFSIYKAPTTYTKLTEDDLYDASDDLVNTGSDTEKAAALASLDAKQGWYITMPNGGEKVLSTAVVVNGVAYFTSYEPTVTTDPCKRPEAGKSRSYAVKTADASPMIVGIGGSMQRSQEISSAGLIDQQRLIFRKGPDGSIQTVMATGTHINDTNSNMNKQLKRIYWYENRQ